MVCKSLICSNESNRPHLLPFSCVIVQCGQPPPPPKKKKKQQVTNMVASSKNVLFTDHSHLLTTGTDDPTLRLSLERT